MSKSNMMRSLFLIIVIVCGFILMDVRYRRAIDSLDASLRSCEDQRQSSMKEPPSMNKTDIALLCNKFSQEASASADLFAFKGILNLWDGQTAVVSVLMESPNDTSIADAAELSLGIASDSWRIDHVNTGNSFPLYPKIAKTDTSVSIIGSAEISGTSLVYGKPNTTYATLTLTRNPASSESSIFQISPQSTNIYHNGISKLDEITSMQNFSLD